MNPRQMLLEVAIPMNPGQLLSQCFTILADCMVSSLAAAVLTTSRQSLHHIQEIWLAVVVSKRA